MKKRIAAFVSRFANRVHEWAWGQAKAWSSTPDYTAGQLLKEHRRSKNLMGYPREINWEAACVMALQKWLHAQGVLDENSPQLVTFYSGSEVAPGSLRDPNTWSRFRAVTRDALGIDTTPPYCVLLWQGKDVCGIKVIAGQQGSVQA